NDVEEINLLGCDIKAPAVIQGIGYPIYRKDAIKSLNLDHCDFYFPFNIHSLPLNNTLDIISCNFYSSVSMPYYMADTLTIFNSNFTETVKIRKHSYQDKIVLILNGNVDIKNLDFDPYEIEFYIIDTFPYTEKLKIISNLLDKLAFYKYEGASAKELEIKYKKLKLDYKGLHFFSWLQEKWWNFGYNQEYIFKNTLFLFFLFFLLNLLFLRLLATEVYKLDKIIEEFKYSEGLTKFKRLL